MLTPRNDEISVDHRRRNVVIVGGFHETCVLLNDAVDLSAALGYITLEPT